jgi:hypothetical protein
MYWREDTNRTEGPLLIARELTAVSLFSEAPRHAPAHSLDACSCAGRGRMPLMHAVGTSARSTYNKSP